MKNEANPLGDKIIFLNLYCRINYKLRIIDLNLRLSTWLVINNLFLFYYRIFKMLRACFLIVFEVWASNCG